MNFEKTYDALKKIELQIDNNNVKIQDGMFKQNNLVLISHLLPALYFRIDKEGLFELMNQILMKQGTLSKENDYNYMIELFYLLQDEINHYYGQNSVDSRDRFYMLNGDDYYFLNGKKIEDDDIRVCTLSQLKGKGIAKCAEKAAVANNVLLFLNQLGLFDYKVNYLNSLLTLEDGRTEGHAFLEFSRKNSQGKVHHLIYDVTNPETISLSGQLYSYPAVYSLTDEEYMDFVTNGTSFDNSKFIARQFYEVVKKREYRGFINEQRKNVK